MKIWAVTQKKNFTFQTPKHCSILVPPSSKHHISIRLSHKTGPTSLNIMVPPGFFGVTGAPPCVAPI